MTDTKFTCAKTACSNPVAKGAAVREPTREYAQQCSCCGGYKNVKNYSCIICRNWLKAKT